MHEEPPEPAVEAVEQPSLDEQPEVTVVPEEAPAVEQADEFKPPTEELVVSQERDVFEVMDANDVEQIIDAMQKRLLDVSLYSFEQGGQRMTELSWKGVRECIHEMHRTGKCRIGIQPETLETATVVDEGDTYYEAAVYAKDEVSGLGFFGFAREPRMMELRNGGKRLDKFAKTKAINKAERNALRKFIPERLAQTLIAQFLKDDRRVKQLRSEGPMAGSAGELMAPTIDTDEGRELIRVIDGLWDQIQAVPGFAATMTPAHFWAYKQRAITQNPDQPEDVSEARRFVETLEQTLSIVRKKAGIVEGTADDA